MKHLKKKKGVTMLETLIVMPVILCFIGFLFIMGQLVTAKATLARATESATRAAVQCSSLSEGRKAADKSLNSNLDNNTLNFSKMGTSYISSFIPGGYGSGFKWDGKLLVCTSAKVKVRFAGLLSLLSSNVDSSDGTYYMTSHCEMVVEHPEE